MITAVVGAGGKTSLIHALARQYRSEGKTVFVTTSTHMYIEPDTLLTDDAEEIAQYLMEHGYVMAGPPAGEKITALSTETYEKICALADEVLVEADGSKHMPIKFPNETEPMIPDNADKIIVVCGLHALHKPAKDVAFRLERVTQCLGITPDTLITPSHIHQLVQKGYVEKLMVACPEKELQIHVAHDGSLYQRALAVLLSSGMDANLIKEEWFAPKPTLFICGGGHVAKELSQFAGSLDFRVTVMDAREDFAVKERFPGAENVICDSFEHLGRYLVPGAYYVVITPGHRDDYDCVRTILGTDYRYLGMIGSRGKVAKVMERLASEGIPEEQRNTIHAPVGLSIGAVTPGEIAISILAEIIQEKNRVSAASVSAELLNTKQHGVLCIITEKTGSAPRGVGSMMLVTEDGQIDTIGGGAVELAAARDARRISEPTLRNYNLSNEGAGNLGMICGGSNRMLFLPL